MADLPFYTSWLIFLSTLVLSEIECFSIIKSLKMLEIYHRYDLLRFPIATVQKLENSKYNLEVLFVTMVLNCSL